MKKRQYGFTFVELMGTLLVGSMMVIGVNAMIDSAMNDTKTQQAALQQSQAADAAKRYIANQYAALLTATGGGATQAVPFTTAVTAPMTQPMTDFLPASFAVGNHPYGKTFCLLVRQRPPLPSTRLDALLITEGGAVQNIAGTFNPDAIAFTDLAYIAANAGQGGGYISGAPLGNLGGALEARGAYNSWRVDGTTVTTLANFTGVNCGTEVRAGQLATAIFYEGPGQFTTDFMYRNAVPNRPDLNTMTTPIAMGAGTTAQVTEDAACPAPIQPGTIAVSNADSADGIVGRVLSCRNGSWQRQGNLSWRNPVAQYSDLALLPAADTTDPRPNAIGDVRMVKAMPALSSGSQPPRPFTWNGSSWQALTADQYGVLKTPEIQISRNNINKGDNCDTGSPAGAPPVPIGRLATDANGLVYSCQYKDATTNTWGTQSTMELGDTEPVNTWIILWNSQITGVPWDSPTPASTRWWPHAWLDYDIPNNWHKATFTRLIKPTRDGLIVANATTVMARQLWQNTSLVSQFEIRLRLYDKDTNALIGNSGTMPGVLNNSAVGGSVSLSKAVSKNTNGYELQVVTGWSTYGSGPGIYDRANYLNAENNWVEQTPLMTTYSMDLFY